jgi:WD40 repeat protein
VTSLAFTPQGDGLATGDWGGNVTVWDLATHRERHLLDGHKGAVQRVVFSPGGTRLATTSALTSAAELRVWDARTGSELASRKGRAAEVNSLAFSLDGKQLLALTSGPRNAVVLREVLTDKTLLTLEGHTGVLASAALSPDRTTIASAASPFSNPPGEQPSEVKLWDVKTGQELRTIPYTPRSVTGLSFSPDGRLLAGVSSVFDREQKRFLNPVIKVWEVQTGREVLSLGTDDGRTGVPVFSPDGEHIAAPFTVGGYPPPTPPREAGVRIWDVKTGKEVRTLKGLLGAATSLCYSPDGTLIAAGTANHSTRVWDLTPAGDGAPARDP